MKRTIRLTESDIHRIVRESVCKVLSESKGSDYGKILRDEYLQAQKDVREARATFHDGIKGSLMSKGYTVVGNHDNYVSFYGPSRLFLFSAHEDYGNYQAPWKMSRDITISFSNYTWKELYQYPDYFHDRDYEDIKVDDFDDFYQRISEDIGEPLVLKPFKTTSESIGDFTKFTVMSIGYRVDVLAEFDNFEEAKKAAYKIAQEKCDEGKKRNDMTSRYYHRSPVDVTRQFTHYAAAYEYYYYNEHACYVVVTAS